MDIFLPFRWKFFHGFAVALICCTGEYISTEKHVSVNYNLVKHEVNYLHKYHELSIRDIILKLLITNYAYKINLQRRGLQQGVLFISEKIIFLARFKGFIS